MYRAYKIAVDDGFEAEIKPSGDVASDSINLRSKLSEMVKKSSLAAESLNANSIWNEWFPDVERDVFISHSSKDGELAKRFALWLKGNFGLSAFVDSDIWGHSDDLLKELDDEHCKNPGGETYSYEKRNGSTAHVHMMLSYALTRMIDKTECFVFLESNNSVTALDSVQGTYSPWIFHELATVDTIESKQSSRMLKALTESVRIFKDAKGLEIKYPVPEKRLTKLNCEELRKWKALAPTLDHHPLDVLYQRY